MPQTYTATFSVQINIKHDPGRRPPRATNPDAPGYDDMGDDPTLEIEAHVSDMGNDLSTHNSIQDIVVEAMDDFIQWPEFEDAVLEAISDEAEE